MHGLALRSFSSQPAPAHGSFLSLSARGQEKPPRFSLKNPPDTWQTGQTGTNQCVQKFGKSSPDAQCQTVHINSATDFCLYGPPTPGVEIGEIEGEVIAYCTKDGYGTRLIPDDTFTSVHFLKTEHYVEVLGTGDFTNIGLQANDSGGELDPHGATGTGNPAGGLVYTTAFSGKQDQIDEWMMFIGHNEFCFRACDNADPLAWQRCQHIYDTEGCAWNMPYQDGYTPNNVFDSCEGDDPYFPGVYDNYTYKHEDGKPPAAHPPPTTKNCKTTEPPSNGSKKAASASGGGAAAANGTDSDTSASSTSSNNSTTGGGTNATGATTGASSTSSSSSSAGMTPVVKRPPTTASSGSNNSTSSNGAASGQGMLNSGMMVAAFLAMAAGTLVAA
ncbi:hypothetical protein OC846_003378 [Tilletia horrida]|uniref:Macrofage activating glycoprotein n=1 Tax=Tilletia horrida TaxID=155126 RepID=A0AAN6JRD7_9BASI|nr:hypothetical protein OC845_005748 [Tilletia horrida]KAK0551239.1 hypothetical protein OC846_003378 [Tilletia horrida]KAK0561616.1 hypothetical protein OC861_005730 [Tilletia horrida]